MLRSPGLCAQQRAAPAPGRAALLARTLTLGRAQRKQNPGKTPPQHSQAGVNPTMAQSLQPASLTCRCDCWYSASLADSARASARSSSSCVLLGTAARCVPRPPRPSTQSPPGWQDPPLRQPSSTAKGREQPRITLNKPGVGGRPEHPAGAGGQHPGPRRTALTRVCKTVLLAAPGSVSEDAGSQVSSERPCSPSITL